MKIPLYYKYDLPIYIEKSDNQFRADKYEHFYPTILRNLLIHCGDPLWKDYPFQPIVDFVIENLPSDCRNILEIGCGVGRLIAEVAQNYPKSNCLGIDYSLQMLKFANNLWVKGKEFEIDGCDMGFKTYMSPSMTLPNVRFAMASASELPLNDQKIEVVIASFLLDKIDDIGRVIKEVSRVLASSGRLIIVSPFNMEKRQNWKAFYPPTSFEKAIENIGFSLTIKENSTIKEPIDRHGNAIHWKCTAYVFRKN